MASTAGENLYSYIKTDQTVTSSTALVSLSDLSFSVDPNTPYNFVFWIPFNLAGIVSGYKFQISTPTTPTTFVAAYQVFTSAGTMFDSKVQTSATAIAGALLSTGDQLIRIEGQIITGSNGGTLSLQFAQNVSNISAIKAYTGGWALLSRVQ